MGSSEHDLPRIFDRFYRADQARSRGVPGSGLGLAIAQWVADAHKGSIEVSSRLGEGSIFRIRLPLASGKNEVSLTVKTTSQSPAAVSESSVI